jgi:hypothetical protein
MSEIQTQRDGSLIGDDSVLTATYCVKGGCGENFLVVVDRFILAEWRNCKNTITSDRQENVRND